MDPPPALEYKMRQIQTFKDSANKYWPELLNEEIDMKLYLRHICLSLIALLEFHSEGESDQIETLEF